MVGVAFICCTFVAKIKYHTYYLLRLKAVEVKLLHLTNNVIL